MKPPKVLLLGATISAALPTFASTQHISEHNNDQLDSKPTTFALLGSNGRYARLDRKYSHSNALIFDSQALGDDPRDATLFILDQDNNALTISTSSSVQFAGFQAMQATNAGTSAIVFEHPNSAGAGYTPLSCHIDDTDASFKCSAQEYAVSSGSITKAREWRVGAESGPQFSVKAVPVSSYHKHPSHTENHEQQIL